MPWLLFLEGQCVDAFGILHLPGIAASQRFQRSPARAVYGSKFENTAFILFVPSLPQSPLSLIPASQINHLHPGPCLKLCSHRNPR